MAKFKPGQSGNPLGRPPGAKATVAVLRKDLISDEDLQDIVDVVIAKAKEGDLTAAGMVLDRRLPKLRVYAEAMADGDLAEKLRLARERAGLDRPRGSHAAETSPPRPTPEPTPAPPREPQPERMQAPPPRLDFDPSPQAPQEWDPYA